EPERREDKELPRLQSLVRLRRFAFGRASAERSEGGKANAAHLSPGTIGCLVHAGHIRRCRTPESIPNATVESGFSRTSLIKISKLVIQAFFELCVLGIGRAGGFGRCWSFASGEADGDKGDADGAACTDQIRKQPGQAVESSIDRRTENLLSPIFLDKRGDDLLARLALFDQCVELRLLRLTHVAVQ